MTPLTQLDPNDAAKAGRDAAEYWGILKAYFPIAATGGIVAVIMHQRKIFRATGVLGKIALAASELSIGSAGAMLTALIYPAVVAQVLPDAFARDIRLELAVCAFLGGSFSERVFRWAISRFIGPETKEQDEAPDYEQPQGRGDVQP